MAAAPVGAASHRSRSKWQRAEQPGPDVRAEYEDYFTQLPTTLRDELVSVRSSALRHRAFVSRRSVDVSVSVLSHLTRTRCSQRINISMLRAESSVGRLPVQRPAHVGFVVFVDSQGAQLGYLTGPDIPGLLDQTEAFKGLDTKSICLICSRMRCVSRPFLNRGRCVAH